jgi:hypothetical protein
LEVRDRIVRGRGDPLAALRERAVTRELRSATAAVLDAFDVQPVTCPDRTPVLDKPLGEVYIRLGRTSHPGCRARTGAAR